MPRKRSAEQPQPETEIVWARLRGFPWWPALAEAARKPKRACTVTFLGTGDHASVEAANLSAFDLSTEASDARFHPPKKASLKPKFHAAIEEAKALHAEPKQAREASDGGGGKGGASSGKRSVGKGAATAPVARPGTDRRSVRDAERSGDSQVERVGDARRPPVGDAGGAGRGRGGLHGARRAASSSSSSSSAAAAVAAASPAAPAARRGDDARLPSVAKVRLESAQHKRPLRNPDASRIAECGFAECHRLVSADLCERITKVPMDTAEGISNAFQLTLGEPHLAEVEAQIGASSQVADAVEAAFGVRRFAVKTVKVLMTEFCAQPQIPHADDYCNRELFGIVHLLGGQPRTECVPYDAAAPYPTNVLVECDKCGEWVPLPDRIGRRRAHVNAPFCCADAGRECVCKPSGEGARRRTAARRRRRRRRRRERRRRLTATKPAGRPAGATARAPAPRADGGGGQRGGGRRGRRMIPVSAATDPLWAVRMFGRPAARGRHAAAPPPPPPPPPPPTPLPATCAARLTTCCTTRGRWSTRCDRWGSRRRRATASSRCPRSSTAAPAGNDEAGSERWVLFFTISPASTARQGGRP